MPTRQLNLEQPTLYHIQLWTRKVDGIYNPYTTQSHYWGLNNFWLWRLRVPRNYSKADTFLRCQMQQWLRRDLERIIYGLTLFVSSKNLRKTGRKRRTRWAMFTEALFVNIAASVSANSNDGFIHYRDPRLIESCLVATKYIINFMISIIFG